MPPGTSGPSGNASSIFSKAFFKFSRFHTGRDSFSAPSPPPDSTVVVQKSSSPVQRLVKGAMPPKAILMSNTVRDFASNCAHMPAFTMEMSSSFRRACLKPRKQLTESSETRSPSAGAAGADVRADAA